MIHCSTINQTFQGLLKRHADVLMLVYLSYISMNVRYITESENKPLIMQRFKIKVRTVYKKFILDVLS